QLVQQRRGRLGLLGVALLISLAIGAALFVLPGKSWVKQKEDLATRTSEMEVLDAAKAQLQTQGDRLKNAARIQEAAREEIDYVDKGEKRISVLPIGSAPVVLPAGWPFDLVTQILAVRQQAAVAAATTTTAP